MFTKVKKRETPTSMFSAHRYTIKSPSLPTSEAEVEFQRAVISEELKRLTLGNLQQLRNEIVHARGEEFYDLNTVRHLVHIVREELAMIQKMYGLASLEEDVANQAWYWTPEWQANEQKVDADLEAGLYKNFSSMEEFLADLMTDED